MTRDLSSLSSPSRGSGLGGQLPALRPAKSAPPVPARDLSTSASDDIAHASPPSPDPDASDGGPDVTTGGSLVSPTGNRRPSAERLGSNRAKSPQREEKIDAAEIETGLRTATVYLPAVLLERVKDAKEVAGTTFTAWILDQLDSHWNELDGLFDKPAPRTSPLPPRGVARRRREVDTPQLLHLRVTQAEFDVIDARASEVGAGSRSAFITEVARLGVEATTDARPNRRRAGVR